MVGILPIQLDDIIVEKDRIYCHVFNQNYSNSWEKKSGNFLHFLQ